MNEANIGNQTFLHRTALELLLFLVFALTFFYYLVVKVVSELQLGN